MAVADRRPAALHPKEIRHEMGLSREKMGYVMSVSAKTIENWERQDQIPADEEKRARLAAIDELVHLGHLVYGVEGLPVFLQTPLRSLGNHTPLQEMMAGRVERVIEVLASEYEGLGF
jgi:DNA-binding XRE family transcriptional regulator